MLPTIIDISRPYIYAFLLIFVSSGSVRNKFLSLEVTQLLVFYRGRKEMKKSKLARSFLVVLIPCLFACFIYFFKEYIWMNDSSSAQWHSAEKPVLALKRWLFNIVRRIFNNTPKIPPACQTKWGQGDAVKSLQKTFLEIFFSPNQSLNSIISASWIKAVRREHVKIALEQDNACKMTENRKPFPERFWGRPS